MESESRLDALLDRLCMGDTEAAELVYLAYEPMLRIVVRRMLPVRLRTRFDSADIVQSVWSDLLRGFREAGWRFADPEHLKAFLIKATRNHYLAEQRKHLGHVDHERSLDAAEAGNWLRAKSPTPCDQARAAELWETILAHCAPKHRELLELRRQGFTFSEIALRTGYHPSSVRRIVFNLIQEMLPAHDAAG
jgi:RNA polymerase sigma factor (sigma-70 family)